MPVLKKCTTKSASNYCQTSMKTACQINSQSQPAILRS